jgi:hypothetical protein
LGVAVYIVLTALDLRLKVLTGVGTADLASFSTIAQFRAAFWAWGPEPYAARAGFDLGLNYLLMPLYAASFFYSGVIAAEGFAPRPGRLRRWILLAAMVPPVGAGFDAAENALHLTMLLNGPTQLLVRLAIVASNVKEAALAVGLALFMGAVMARVNQRRQARLAGNGGDDPRETDA